MSECQNCGSKVDVTDNFCPHCGYNLTVKKPKSQPSNKSKNIFIVVGIIIFVIFIVWLVRKPPSPSPNHTEKNAYLNNFSEPQGTLDEIRKLEKAVISNPKDCETRLQLAHLYQDVGRLSESIEAYTIYLEEHPENAEARIDFGVSYYRLAFEDTVKKLDHLKKAINEMKIALKYAPNHQLGHFNLGVVNLQSGNITEAIKWFDKCIAIDSNSNIAVKAKEILDHHISQ